MNDLYSQALNLPDQQRGELAIILLESLADKDTSPIELNPAYEAELRRRLANLDQGRAKKHSLEEVMARLRDPSRRRERQ
jgi:putative addiction module component (TIGR02574 family)